MMSKSEIKELFNTGEEQLLRIFSMIANGEHEKIKTHKFLSSPTSSYHLASLVIDFDGFLLQVKIYNEEHCAVRYIEAKQAQKDLFEYLSTLLIEEEGLTERFEFIYQKEIDEDRECHVTDVFSRGFISEFVKLGCRIMETCLEEQLTSNCTILREIARIAVEEQENASA